MQQMLKTFIQYNDIDTRIFPQKSVNEDFQCMAEYMANTNIGTERWETAIVSRDTTQRTASDKLPKPGALGTMREDAPRI
jgi:hypothetical protein